MKSTFLVLGLFVTLALASYQDKDKHYDYHDKNVKSYDPYYNPWVPAKYYDHQYDYDKKGKHYRRSKRSPIPTDDGKKDDYDDKVKYDPYYNPNLKYYDPYYNPWVPAKYYDHKDDYDDKKGKNYKRSPVPTDHEDYYDVKNFNPYYNPWIPNHYYDQKDGYGKNFNPYYNPWIPAKYYDHKDDYDEKEKHYKRSKRSPVPTDDGKKDDYDDNKVKYDPYYNPNLKYYDPYYNPWVPAKYYDHKDDYDDKKGKNYKRSPVPTDHDEDYYDVKYYDPYYNPWVPAKYYDHKDDYDDKKGKFYKRFNRSKRSKRSPVPT